MRSREVVCYSCNHQFRHNILDDESYHVRSRLELKLKLMVLLNVLFATNSCV